MRSIVVGLILAAMIAPSLGCDIAFLDGRPTNEDYIAEADVAFIGTAIGIRLNSGEVISEFTECHERAEHERDACRNFSSNIMTAIFSVDVPIHGIESNRLYELYRTIGDGECLIPYQIGRRYLMADYGLRELQGMPSAEQIAAWRALELR